MIYVIGYIFVFCCVFCGILRYQYLHDDQYDIGLAFTNAILWPIFLCISPLVLLGYAAHKFEQSHPRQIEKRNGQLNKQDGQLSLNAHEGGELSNHEDQ